MSELIITRGIPASGKTTWARIACDRDNWVRVNRDDLRMMLHGGTYSGIYENEKEVSIAQKAMVRALLKAGKSVIVDDTNLRQRYVKDWMVLANECGAGFAAVDFTDVDLEVCITRDLARGYRGERSVGKDVIRDMHQRYLAGKRLPLPLPSLDEVKPKYEPYEIDQAERFAPTAYLVDIDGTLALHGDRSPYDESRVSEDAPNTSVIEVVNKLEKEHYIILVSGRSDGCRRETQAWLDRHGVQYDGLHMRASGDTRKDVEVKYELFNERIRHKYRVLGVFDDRNSVVRLWRDMGLTVFQVNYGDF